MTQKRKRENNSLSIKHFLVIATISTSILKLYSLGTMIIVMTSTPKYLEKFELLSINLKYFWAKSAMFHLYFLLSSYQCQHSKCLLLVFVLLSLIHVYIL